MLDRGPAPAVVLGGRSYVAGELLRLLTGHPDLAPAVVTSTSQAGEPVATAFPHLAGVLPSAFCFTDQKAFLGDPAAHLPKGEAPVAVFAATPHGETAAILDRAIAALERVGFAPHAVDLSADYRFGDPARYTEVYGREHGAPERVGSFVCAVPEHYRGPAPRHAAQPGCFTTAVVLAAYPFFASGLAAGPLFVSAITGSSGSGRTPATNTHHAERRSTVYAYAPLVHRHEAEMRVLLAGGGAEPEVEFVPHSGPFVRGIHATLRIPLLREMTPDALVEEMGAFYAAAPFVSVLPTPPRLIDVVGTNHCRLGVSVRGRTAVVTSVIDNLVKGAAGGAVQWMNRLLALPDDRGLRAAGLGVY